MTGFWKDRPYQVGDRVRARIRGFGPTIEGPIKERKNRGWLVEIEDISHWAPWLPKAVWCADDEIERRA